MNIVTQKQQTVQFGVLTDSRQTVEDSSGQSDTEPTDGTALGTDRQWTDCIYSGGYSDTETTYGTV